LRRYRQDPGLSAINLLERSMLELTSFTFMT
jgi:hypothetical protein